MTTFAERLRQLRGTRQSKEFAEAAGISSGSLSAYENGSSMPTSRVLSRISENLGVPLEWLLSGDGLPPEKEKTCDIAGFEKASRLQPLEITAPQKAEPATSQEFSQKIDQMLALAREAQVRMLSMMDRQEALMNENAALREERAELRAEVRRLETELQRYKNGELPLFNAPGASAARKSRPGSEEDDEMGDVSPAIGRPDIGGLAGRGGAADGEASKK